MVKNMETIHKFKKGQTVQVSVWGQKEKLSGQVVGFIQKRTGGSNDYPLIIKYNLTSNDGEQTFYSIANFFTQFTGVRDGEITFCSCLYLDNWNGKLFKSIKTLIEDLNFRQEYYAVKLK